MYPGYLLIQTSGIELINHPRTIAYLRGNVDSGGAFCGLLTGQARMRVQNPCTGLTGLLADVPYVDPATDGAPWYDPTRPESTEFAGLLLDKPPDIGGVYSRDVNASVYGAVIGDEKPGIRSMKFTGWLWGSTQMGALYGLQWLTRALVALDDDTSDNALRFLISCPPASPTPTLTQYARYMVRAMCTSAPRVVAQSPSCDRIKVEFTITAEMPDYFSEPAPLEQIDFTTVEDPTCIEFVIGDDCPDCHPELLTLEREVRKPRSTVLLNEDYTWCSTDFGSGTIPYASRFLVPVAITNKPDDCVLPIRVRFDRTWQPLGWSASRWPACGCAFEAVDVVYSDKPDPIDPDTTCTWLISVNLTDDTWTPIRWDDTTTGPPWTHCKIEIGELVYELLAEGAIPDVGEILPHPTTVKDECKIALAADGTFVRIGGWVGGFAGAGQPPDYCDIVVDQPGYPEPPAPKPATSHVVGSKGKCYVSLNNDGTWAPVGWSGGMPQEDWCDIGVVTPGPCCGLDARELPVELNANGTYRPIGWAVEPGNFPPAGLLVIRGQDETMLGSYQVTEESGFVPACDPLPFPSILLPEDDLPCEGCWPIEGAQLCVPLAVAELFADATLIVDVHSGAGDTMLNLRVDLYAEEDDPCNPTLVPCAEPLWSAVIAELPAASEIRIDGRSRRILGYFPGDVIVNGLRYVSGDGKAIFDWPDLAPGTGYVLMVTVNNQAFNLATTVDVSVVSRYRAL